jgi:nucleoid-associated protein YgaU
LGRLAWIALLGGGLTLGAWSAGWAPSWPGTVPVAHPLAVAPLPVTAPPRSEAVASSPVARAPAVRPEPLGPDALRFDVARLGRSGALVTAGRAAPGAEVALMENGVEIGRGRADGRGEWVILPDAPLAAGARELSLVMRLPGAAPVEGEGRVVMVVPEAAGAVVPEAPGAMVPEAAGVVVPEVAGVVVPEVAGAAPLVLLLGRDAPVVALQAPAAARLGLDLVDYRTAGELRFAGGAPAGAALRLYVDGAAVGDAAADGAGRWSFALDGVAVGRHVLRVDQLDPRGRVAARIEQPFQRDEVREAGATEVRRVVQPGNTLWRISRDVYGQGTRFTLIFAANRAQIRDPNRIFPGQVFSLPTPAASSLSR